jgi:aspartate kinase
MTPITRGTLFSQVGGSGSGSGEGSSPPGSPSPRNQSNFSRPHSIMNLTSMLPNYSVTVDLIRQEHFDAARASVRDPVILQELEAEIDKDCEWLRSFLFAAQVRLRSSITIVVYVFCFVGYRRDFPPI